MDMFEKCFYWTLAIGFGALGIFVGLLVLKIAIGVAGFLLGSSTGTLVLAWFLWKIYEHHKKHSTDL